MNFETFDWEEVLAWPIKLWLTYYFELVGDC